MTSSRDRILLVTPASPFLPRSGAQQRTALLYEALRTLGEVDVLLLEPSSGPTRLEPAAPGILAHALWRQQPLGIAKFKPDAALKQLLETNGVDLTRYRLLVSRYLGPITKLHLPRSVRTVVDLDDWSYHYGDGSALTTRIKSAYARWLAQRNLPRFDAFFFVSERDQRAHPTLAATILPNIPFNPPPEPFAQVDSTTVLFVGALWYAPNRHGVEHFLAACWPRIRSARPDTRLMLVGAAPPELRRGWEQTEGVSAPGFIDDLAKAYRDAALTIAPINAGGGSNIKILESLAYGRVCVTTSYCAQAFDAALAETGLGIASDDDQFVQRCIAWLDAPAQRARQAEKASELLKKRYSRSLFFERVVQRCGPFLAQDTARGCTQTPSAAYSR